MSGGGGSFGRGDRLGISNIPTEARGRRFNCAKVNIHTILNSPNIKVIKKLRVGDILDIEVDSNTGALVAVFNGQIVGSITISRLAELLECMNQDYDYYAEVTNILGGRCEVDIKNQ